MAISERQVTGVTVLAIDGLIGVGGEEALHERVQQRIASGERRFVFEMARVPHVDSTGIAALIGSHVSISNAGGRLVLAGLNDHVRKVLTVTRLLTVFEHREREADAIARALSVAA